MANRSLDNAIFGPCARPDVVFLCRDTEEQDRRDSKRDHLVQLGVQVVERELELSGHRADLVADAFAFDHEERVDEVTRGERCLAREGAKRRGLPQPSGALE